MGVSRHRSECAELVRRHGLRRWLVRFFVPLLLAWTWCGSRPALAQDAKREDVFATWVGLMTSFQVRGPWALWFDTHYNSRAFIVVRPGITYNFKAGPSVTVGYAHLWTHPGNDTLTRDENRLWAQAFVPFSFGEPWRISQRMRFEYRLRQNVASGEVISGWSGIFRVRSQTAAAYWIPSKRPSRFFIQAAIELLANGGKNAGPNFLDQSRMSLMLGMKRATVTLRIGYMDRFVPGASGTRPVHEHNAVLWVNYSFHTKPGVHSPSPLASKIGSPEASNP